MASWNEIVARYQPDTSYQEMTDGTGANQFWDRVQPQSTPDPNAPPAPQNPWEKLIGMADKNNKKPVAHDTKQISQAPGGKVDPEYIKTGLVKRGLPEHWAEGIVMNMKDESGLDSGINEIAPTVKGSRGGFGLYQLTGPRRRAYEKVAKDNNVDPSDVDAQLDFLVHELKTTEKKAFRNLGQAKTAGQAAAIFVDDFLRPADEHKERRMNKYLTGEQSVPAPSSEPNRLWLK